MIEQGHPQLSIRRQSQLLQVNRNRLTPRSSKRSEEDLLIMRLMDEVHIKDPSYGVRMMKYILARDHGLRPGRSRIRRLMKLAGIRACYPKPRTSLSKKDHKKYPYLLREMDISEADEVWCSDITYIPMEKGFCYLAAVMDWHTRAVLGWAISTTMDTTLCKEAFEMALQMTGRKPAIMNTDQGSQYTSDAWTETMKSKGILISMDGKGCWVDNVFIERLWRSLKYEDIYLKSYATSIELERGVSEWMKRYNHYRPHSFHDGETPEMGSAKDSCCL